ncbi:MAG: hypothetical protein O7E54_08180 [Planctomycetota bacterium]|nr:hypothetical protein [Planctomycetota bacterium]
MRRLFILTLLTAAVAAGKREQRYVKLGQAQLAAADKSKSKSSGLRRLRRATYYFKRAGKDGVPDLVRTLNRTAALYYGRKSLSLAEKRINEALKLAPKDKDALALQAAIKKAKATDIYDSVGTVAINRVRARRLAAGIPLRNRGLAKRR